MARKQTTAPAEPDHGYTIQKRDRDWLLYDPAGELVCITVYKRGAKEVIRRLTA
ncbi:MAG TPA: hypothetical protein VF665_21280 [Longimicrobium sp.]|jgi:hypothetical protein|uniref:hypothetical protein n=1 Tax=Longimicrobium sp. TaxID=2029185 RepID=UPI002ED9C622